MSAGAVPPLAALVALAGLPELGPARLRALLDIGTPADVLAALRTGGPGPTPRLEAACQGRFERMRAAWQVAARAVDEVAVWRRHADAGVAVLAEGGAGWPAALVGDPEPPAVLFGRGRPDVLAGPRVAVVGTRRCTRYGFDLARRFGRELSEAGVSVVSGLALGIDGAAHRGVLDVGGAPPIGVVASGLDVAYPRQHAGLWRDVGAHGVVLSEAPLGTRPARWRFPARNRIIAALADVVLVVESAERGGALHTVDEAVRRDRPVLAVPGPVTSVASAGTNRLLADVATPACEPADVLLALGLSPGATRASAETRPPPDDSGRVVLDALGWQPCGVAALVERCARPAGEVALALARLEADGWVTEVGGWYERVLRGAS